LIQPSVKLARNGFPVDSDLIYIFQGLDNSSFLVNNPEWATDFAPRGTLLGEGDILVRSRYARLLEEIAEYGPDVFYTGNIARATIAALQAQDGIMTMDDLENYSVLVRAPVELRYRDFNIVSCAAPAGGSVVLSVMNTIHGYRDIGSVSSLNLGTHLLDEAIRFGYGAVSFGAGFRFPLSAMSTDRLVTCSEPNSETLHFWIILHPLKAQYYPRLTRRK
jgi:gamma-glutamyltranspeptidase/glutathione hydrolase